MPSIDLSVMDVGVQARCSLLMRKHLANLLDREFACWLEKENGRKYREQTTMVVDADALKCGGSEVTFWIEKQELG